MIIDCITWNKCNKNFSQKKEIVWLVFLFYPFFVLCKPCMFPKKQKLFVSLTSTSNLCTVLDRKNFWKGFRFIRFSIDFVQYSCTDTTHNAVVLLINVITIQLCINMYLIELSFTRAKMVNKNVFQYKLPSECRLVDVTLLRLMRVSNFKTKRWNRPHN